MPCSEAPCPSDARRESRINSPSRPRHPRARSDATALGYGAEQIADLLNLASLAATSTFSNPDTLAHGSISARGTRAASCAQHVAGVDHHGGLSMRLIVNYGKKNIDCFHVHP